MYLNSTSRADNEADGPFPLHPPLQDIGGGTELAHLRRRDGSRGHQDPVLAVASSI